MPTFSEMQLGHKTRAGCTLSLGTFILYSTLIPRYHCTYNDNIALIILEQFFTNSSTGVTVISNNNRNKSTIKYPFNFGTPIHEMPITKY